MSFNKWFVGQVVDMANDYECRINKLESDVRQLKSIITNIYADTEVERPTKYDVDVRVNLNVALPGHHDVHLSDVFNECTICDACDMLLSISDEECPCHNIENGFD